MAAVGEPGKFGVVVVQPFDAVVGEAGGQQGIGHAAAAAHLESFVVAPGAMAWGRPEELVEGRQGQGSEQGPAPPGESHGGAEEGEAVGVIGGAIQGVDTPLQIAFPGPAAALLGVHRDAGGLGRQDLQHRILGGMVRFGHQVAGRPLGANLHRLAEQLP